MNKNNTFDDVMDFIDNNIMLDDEKMSRGIYATSGYSDMDYNKFMSILSSGKITLNSYIRKRRLYFAAKELVECTDKPIIDIALDYGYSEQSSFSRAFKNEYGFTPNEVRKKAIIVEDNRAHFSDFVSNKSNSRLASIFEMLDYDGIHGSDVDYFESFINAVDEYGFDTATCCAISEISERLEVPFEIMLNSCFDTMVDVHTSPNYLEPRIEHAIDCGISSDDEFDKICEYYNCKYYQVDRFMVESYREAIKEK